MELSMPFTLFYSPEDLGRRANLSGRRIIQLIEAGDIRVAARTVGNASRHLISQAEAERFLRSRRIGR
jgi:hypothetical protein